MLLDIMMKKWRVFLHLLQMRKRVECTPPRMSTKNYLQKEKSMHKVSYSQTAKNDLLTIWSFIADDNPIYADKVVDTIVAFIANLTYFPSL